MDTKANVNSDRIYPFGGNMIYSNGSDMPIETSLRAWTWRNPLNVLPLSILILLVIGILGMLS